MSGLAAEVAFFGVLSVFPALLAFAAAVGYLDALVGSDLARRVEDSVVDGLGRVLTEEAARTTEAVSALFQRGNGEVLSLALLGAVWASSRGAVATLRAVAVIYGVADRRPWWRRRALAVGLALGTILAVAVALSAIVVGPLFGQGPELASLLGLGDAFATAWTWVRLPVALLLLTGWMAVLFHLAPDDHVGWRADLPGAALAAVTWVVLSVGLRVSIAASATTNQVLGALGGVLVVLMWIYLLSLGLLAGATLNATLLARRHPGNDSVTVGPVSRPESAERVGLP